MEAIEPGKAELHMDAEGIIQLKWLPHTSVGLDDAEAAMSKVNELCGTTTHPMLVDMSSVANVSRQAREVFARPCQASPIALLGASPVDQVLANFVMAMNRSRPKRFFTSRAEATTG